MKKPEENDELWQLLGEARASEVSPFFARNVLREIRTARQEKTGVLAWLRKYWRTAALGSAAAVLLAVNATGQFRTTAGTRAPAEIAQQAPSKTDYEVISHLDELVAYEQSSIWLDDSAQ